MNELTPVVLVTGGARRVGRAVINRLAQDGYDGVFTYMTGSGTAQSLVRDLQQQERKFVAVQADLTRPDEAVPAIAQAVESSFGRLNLLVNNASVYEPAALDAETLDHARRLFDLHVHSPLLLSQRFAPLLRASHGSIINMADLLAERPWPRYLAYCASKAALVNLTLSLARELAPDVTVNAIAPGVVDWPDDLPETERSAYLQRVPLARPGTPDDVAELVRFLCTAGRYITGQVIRLDGGRSIVP